MNTIKVRTLRKRRGLRQSDMAEALGITKATYSKKESGSIKFSLEESRFLALFFDTTIEELFFETESHTA
ncbi:helix-turn-helix domain-containing protein [Bacillus inaquosorum]|uniref:helix-turn-helix transcriptional regulator n=1 Tax=Bacillus inaquosorum TaxID=483913 RepID=UPI0022820274|nr:helix-turn-helix transcriptional regulator [Bacillus inaquosorum]MCY8081771.1 helix-turn-helix domain-containing protein [Bacillus inaquosorum]